MLQHHTPCHHPSPRSDVAPRQRRTPERVPRVLSRLDRDGALPRHELFLSRRGHREPARHRCEQPGASLRLLSSHPILPCQRCVLTLSRACLGRTGVVETCSPDVQTQVRGRRRPGASRAVAMGRRVARRFIALWVRFVSWDSGTSPRRCVFVGLYRRSVSER